MIASTQYNEAKFFNVLEHICYKEPGPCKRNQACQNGAEALRVVQSESPAERLMRSRAAAQATGRAGAFTEMTKFCPGCPGVCARGSRASL